MGARIAVVGVLGLASLHCGGCDESKGLAEEGTRLWGREKVAAEMEARANEPIDVRRGDDPAIRDRLLRMAFTEVVARFGFLRYEGTARFDLSRKGNRLPVFEKTIIEHGLHGSFRVVQKDEDDSVTRESIFNNGVYYIRNGALGQMRVQGVIEDRHLAMREEAWSPLRTFTAYFGPRLGLAPAGQAIVHGRSAIRYELVLLDGPARVTAPGMKGEKEPVAVSGEVCIDEATAVPTKAKLRGELRIPGAEGSEPGVLKVFLDMSIRRIDGAEIRPKKFVPTISHRPVDLDPLKFLEGDTRTSTVIRGE